MHHRVSTLFTGSAASQTLTLALGLLMLSPSAGCEPDETYERPGRGLENPNAGGVSSLPPTAAPAEAPSRRAPGSGGAASGPGAFGSPTGSPTGAAAGANEAPAGPRRDLSAELNAALGQPVACTAGAPSAPTITVNVATIVNEEGLVLRATASGGLSPAGIECMQARARAVRFRAPVPRAPINVTTTVTFRQTSPGTPATRTLVETPRVLPPGAVDPMGGNAVPIAPRSGQAIAPSAGQPVVAAPGTPVSATQGVSIMGPSGTPIGR